MNYCSIITHPTVRVLSVPHWAKPLPPVILIATDVYTRIAYHMYEPWVAIIEYMKIDLIGVNMEVVIDPDNPQVVHTITTLTESWPNYSFTFTSGGGEPNYPIPYDVFANLDLVRMEAERVRDDFPWGLFDVEYGQDNRPKVRVVPLCPERLTNFVFPHDCSKFYNGDCQVNRLKWTWEPPPGELIDDQPWREEVEQWRDSIDWWQVVSRKSNIPRETLARDGSLHITTKAAIDDKPTWQLTVQWQSHSGGQDITFIHANRAENRLIQVDPQNEIRELWRISWHPATGEFQQLLIITGERTVSLTPFWPPIWKVEAYA